MVPYESLRGKKERALDTCLGGEVRAGTGTGRRGETFRGGASRPGRRWNGHRAPTKLHKCVFFEGRGLNLKVISPRR